YSPLFFVRGGLIATFTLDSAGYIGRYWSSTMQPGTGARAVGFDSSSISPQRASNRYIGFSLRCLDYIPIPKIKVLSIAHYSSSAEAPSAVAL
ncbi:hypothetical protein IKD57_01800, partial [Candidatus Saccharibacteria bacterium]|nr:hypothetical protein [Candidatus Saccharibacteria bacterium]